MFCFRWDRAINHVACSKLRCPLKHFSRVAGSGLDQNSVHIRVLESCSRRELPSRIHRTFQNLHASTLFLRSGLCGAQDDIGLQI